MPRAESTVRHLPITAHAADDELHRELDRAVLRRQFANADEHRAGAIEELMDDLP
ncbi:hypothetical protein GS490_11280 [Rhodococcus hoagii]|nr:hypothetical protein [Prescottella equi]